MKSLIYSGEGEPLNLKTALMLQMIADFYNISKLNIKFLLRCIVGKVANQSVESSPKLKLNSNHVLKQRQKRSNAISSTSQEFNTNYKPSKSSPPI